MNASERAREISTSDPRDIFFVVLALCPSARHPPVLLRKLCAVGVYFRHQRVCGCCGHMGRAMRPLGQSARRKHCKTTGQSANQARPLGQSIRRKHSKAQALQDNQQSPSVEGRAGLDRNPKQREGTPRRASTESFTAIKSSLGGLFCLGFSNPKPLTAPSAASSQCIAVICVTYSNPKQLPRRPLLNASRPFQRIQALSVQGQEM